MTHPEVEVLAGLALGDDAEPEVRAHVEGCASCRETLAALSDVHAAARSGEALVPAPEGLRERVLAEVAADAASSHAPSETSHAHPPARRPDEPVVPLDEHRRRRRGVPLWAAGLAAAVTLAAGVGLGRVTVDHDTPEPDDGGSVVAEADLAPLEGRTASGMASAVSSGGSITLRVRARELGDDAGFHEVWLLNVDGTRMVAVGLLASGDEGEFQVPQRLLDEGYRIVDISIEPDDGDPTHSGVSLARGELA